MEPVSDNDEPGICVANADQKVEMDVQVDYLAGSCRNQWIIYFIIIPGSMLIIIILPNAQALGSVNGMKASLSKFYDSI